MEEKKNSEEINLEKIVETLKKHPEGLMIKEISELTKLSRITVIKYVHYLIGQQKVIVRNVGRAKLVYWKG